MWAKWRDAVPAKLVTEDPGILSRFLTLTSRKAGISRSELEQALGFLQPRVNKLAMKLLEDDWLEIVKKRRGKVTIEFLRMTPLAKSSMKKLESSLRVLSAPPSVASSARSNGGRLHAPPNAVGSLFDLVPRSIPRRKKT